MDYIAYGVSESDTTEQRALCTHLNVFIPGYLVLFFQIWKQHIIFFPFVKI